MTALPDAQLTHVGIAVFDMAAMVEFYTRALGLVVTDDGEHTGRHLVFLSRRADEHHQVALVSGRTAPRGVSPVGQVSFRVDGLSALRSFHDQVLACGATNLEGRNHGNSWSIYFEDPEGNRLEVYCPTPWYVQQPWRVPLDLSRTDAEIVADTEALLPTTPSWRPAAEWSRDLAARLAE